jgi:hypothetical protein
MAGLYHAAAGAYALAPPKGSIQFFGKDQEILIHTQLRPERRAERPELVEGL